MSGKFGPGVPKLVTSWTHVKMPQANNPQVRRDMELSPVGPGTVFTRLVHMSKVTRERANLINKTEEARLQKIEKLIEKEHKFKSNLQNKVIERTTKTLKEKQALLKILSGEYKFDNFVTMQRGFDSNQIEMRDIARRYVMESRVFNSGFNVKALKPEVCRQIRKLDPNHKYRTFKKRLLSNCKDQNIELNRAMSNSTFYRMLHDREHWREYNDISRSNRRHLQFGSRADNCEHIPTPKERLDGSSDLGPDEKIDISENKDGVADEVKEKSIVVEKRLLRRKQDAFGMTMNTLGPVYFQASVHTLAQPDVEVVGAS